MINSMNLPSPRPLLPSLLEAGFSNEIAIAASKLYQQRAEEFKRRTETMLMTAWRKIAALPGASTLSLDPLTRNDFSAFTEVYLRYLEEWKEEMVQVLRQTSKVPSKATLQKNTRPFNHEYVPLLEQFFEENPFPTHADKVSLAKESNMEYKQIHVWFQNRRNRTKTVTKRCRRKLISQGPSKLLGKPNERTRGCVVKPVYQIQPRTSSSRADDQLRFIRNNASNGAFISPAPPHAFPSSYPPKCAYDPFPCTSGPISFEKPGWRRVPCSELPLSVSINIDGLVEEFSQLSVRGDTCMEGYPRLRSHAATAAITVIPSHAPHPSLIVHKRPKCTSIVLNQTSSIIRCRTSASKPAMQMPLSAPTYKGRPSTKRKAAPLPQRFPVRVQDTKRHTTPSECSTTSSSGIFSPDSQSRSSSLSSVSPSSPPKNTVDIQGIPQ